MRPLRVLLRKGVFCDFDFMKSLVKVVVCWVLKRMRLAGSFSEMVGTSRDMSRRGSAEYFFMRVSQPKTPVLMKWW